MMNNQSSHLTEDQKHAANIGMRMSSKGFTLDDNPYGQRRNQDLSEAWQRGFNWYKVLMEFSAQAGIKSKIHEVA